MIEASTRSQSYDSLRLFRCNVCGCLDNKFVEKQLSRESAPCTSCGLIVRERALVYLIGRHLFGCPVPPLTEWPYHHDLRVLGISDGAGFAARLGPKFNYENTNYHIEPFFDVKAPPQRYLGAAMVICSEVLEHVAHPVEPAFSGLCSVLKPGGLLVFSVPWTTGEPPPSRGRRNPIP